MIQRVTGFSRVLGCDVGKDEIVVFDTASKRIVRLANRPDRLAAFAASLDANCLAVCEATGGYELALLSALLEAGVPAHRADARSKLSSDPSERSARPTRSTLAPWRVTRPNGAVSCPSGARARKRA
jgi:transposase